MKSNNSDLKTVIKQTNDIVKTICKLPIEDIRQFTAEAQKWLDDKSSKLFIVEGVASVYHYHLSKSGKTGQPALCGNNDMMHTEIPLTNWNSKPDHIPSSYCKECEKLK